MLTNAGPARIAAACACPPEIGHIEFVFAGLGRVLRGPAEALATAILDHAYRL